MSRRIPVVDDEPDVSRLLARRPPMLGEAGILILTARGEEIDRISGFEVDADDYVVKPFSVREVVLRVLAEVWDTSSASATASDPPPVSSRP